MLAVFSLVGTKMAELAAAGAPPGTPKLAVYQPAALLTVPLFHCTATHALFLPCFFSGSKLVIMCDWLHQRAHSCVHPPTACAWVLCVDVNLILCACV